MYKDLLSLNKINMLRNRGGVVYLPVMCEEFNPLKDGTQVRLLLTCNGTFDVRSQFPICFKQTYGNSVQFAVGQRHETEIDPYFVFDSAKEMWHLVHVGYVCFHEQEVYNYPKSYTPNCGEGDATEHN